MKITFINLLIIFTLFSGYSQNKEQMKTFDIETFNKNKENNEYFFTTSEDLVIKQYKGDNDYWETIQHKDSIFENYFEYYLDGKLKRAAKSFPNSFLIGFMKQYDENGKLIKQTDLDEPFNCTWEDIKVYLEKHGVDDIKKQVVRITRWGDKEEATWTLQFNGNYKDIIGRFKITLDGKTGEELEVKLFKGKKALGKTGTVADYQILFIKE